MGWSPATWLVFFTKRVLHECQVFANVTCVYEYHIILRILDTPIPWSQLSGILNYGDSRRVVTALTLTYEVTTLGPQSWLGSWSNMHRKNCCFNSIGKARKLRDGPGKITHQAARDPVDWSQAHPDSQVQVCNVISMLSCFYMSSPQTNRKVGPGC